MSQNTTTIKSSFLEGAPDPTWNETIQQNTLDSVVITDYPPLHHFNWITIELDKPHNLNQKNFFDDNEIDLYNENTHIEVGSLDNKFISKLLALSDNEIALQINIAEFKKRNIDKIEVELERLAEISQKDFFFEVHETFAERTLILSYEMNKSLEYPVYAHVDGYYKNKISNISQCNMSLNGIDYNGTYEITDKRCSHRECDLEILDQNRYALSFAAKIIDENKLRSNIYDLKPNTTFTFNITFTCPASSIKVK